MKRAWAIPSGAAVHIKLWMFDLAQISRTRHLGLAGPEFERDVYLSLLVLLICTEN
jgi:hypothetical protein